MVRSIARWRCSRSVAAASLLSAIGLLSDRAEGQVVVDGSLGPSAALSGPNFQVTPDKGRQVGSNLFHSFQTFNLAAGESATFSGPTSVQRVLTRVTGGTPSTIDGTLRCTIPNADFYFINPAGVVFGPNASLDVQGSFAVTTADAIRLDDGGSFAASDLAGDSVLTSAPPAAFGFVAATPAAIAIMGDRNLEGTGPLPLLEVRAAQTLSITAGEVRIVSGELIAPGGRISVVAKGNGQPADFEIAPAGAVVSEVARAEGGVVLQDTLLATDGPAGGRIDIWGGDVVLDEAILSAVTEGSLDGEGIDVRATGTLTLRGAALLATTESAGRGGDISLTAGSALRLVETEITAGAQGDIDQGPEAANLLVGLDLQHPFVFDLALTLVAPDGTQVILFENPESFTSADFIGTILDDRAEESIEFANAPFTGRFRPAEPFANLIGSVASGTWRLDIDDADAEEPDAGTLTGWSLQIGGLRFESADVPKPIPDGGVVSSVLNVSPEGLVVTSTQAIGEGGSIRFASGGPTHVTSGFIENLASGVGAQTGGIELVSGGDLTVDGRSTLQVGGGDGGRAGGLLANSAGTLRVSGNSSLFAVSSDGAAGDVTLNAAAIVVQGPRAEVGTDGIDGSVGSFRAAATGELLILDGGGIVATADQSLGSLHVSAGNILIRGGDSGIFVLGPQETEGTTGSVHVTASQSIELAAGGTILASGSGPEFALSLTAPRIVLDGEGELLPTSVSISRSLGEGQTPFETPAISINAETMRVLGGAQVEVGGFFAEQPEIVDITVPDVLVSGAGSTISSSTFAGDSTGAVHIRSDTLRVVDGGAIAANAFRGGGGARGALTIQSRDVVLQQGGSISATSGGGLAEELTVKTEFEPEPGLPPLAADLVLISPAGTRIRLSDSAVTSAFSDDSVDLENRPLEPLARFVAADLNGQWSLDVRLRRVSDPAERVPTLRAWTLEFGGTEIGRSTEPVSGAEFRSALSVIGARTGLTGGSGGDIDIRAESVSVVDGGSISATTRGTGAAGSVGVNARNIQMLGSGSSIESASDTRTLAALIRPDSGTVGNAGDVAVTAEQFVRVRDGAAISVQSDTGGAGSISIAAGNSIELRGGSITAQALAGSGGNIKLTAPEAVHILESVITAEAARLPEPGQRAAQIDIDPRFVILRNSTINGLITDPAAPRDVPVIIDRTASFVRSSDSSILSNAVSAPVEVDIAGSLARLPGGLVEAGARLEEACHERLAAPISTFVTTGRGGTPLAPGGWGAQWELAESRR